MNAQATDMTESLFHSALHKDISKPINPYTKVRDPNDSSALIEKHNGAHQLKWANTTIDYQKKSIRINVYLNFKNSGLTEMEYAMLKQLASNGIKKYWSRSIKINNEQYAVVVHAMHRKGRAIDVKLKISDDPKGDRSYNPGGFTDASFIYNRGLFKRYTTLAKTYADMDFQLISAHEFGHSILMHAGGSELSWGHKGSTGVINQKVKKSTPGYPIKGHIDLMKYYDDKKTDDSVKFIQIMERTIAAKIDIKRLIWGSKLQWKK